MNSSQVGNFSGNDGFYFSIFVIEIQVELYVNYLKKMVFGKISKQFEDTTELISVWNFLTDFLICVCVHNFHERSHVDGIVGVVSRSSHIIFQRGNGIGMGWTSVGRMDETKFVILKAIKTNNGSTEKSKIIIKRDGNRDSLNCVVEEEKNTDGRKSLAYLRPSVSVLAEVLLTNH